MLPRQPLIPNRGVAARSLTSIFVEPTGYKSIEEPSIVAWTSPGKGMNGENSTGNSNAVELWRSLNMRRKWGAK